MRTDAFARLDHPFIQHFRQPDVKIEQTRPGLGGDPQRIAKAPGNHQYGALALAFQERIRGHRGSHFDAGHPRGRNGFIGSKTEHPPDTFHRGVVILRRIFRQQLEGVQFTLGRASDDIGERAAAIDPKLPAGHVTRVCPDAGCSNWRPPSNRHPPASSHR